MDRFTQAMFMERAPGLFALVIRMGRTGNVVTRPRGGPPA